MNSVEQVNKFIDLYRTMADQTIGGVGLSVGAGNIEYRIRQHSVKLMLDTYLQSNDLEAAKERAVAYARELVKQHNARRPKDINWQRWEGTADSEIMNAYRILNND